MDTGWTRERALGLAPDPASAKAGEGLASPRKWVSLGREQSDVLWGECQGSGPKPYQVQIDLREPAFKCSCPSRKFPCKHGLGLLLIFAAAPDQLAQSARPQWVDEWVSGRVQRAETKAQKAQEPPKPVDLESQAARRAKRLDKIAAGIASLRTWTDDLVRNGIATAQAKGYAFFDEPARRMIDAQAPGAARMVRLLGETAASGSAGWQQKFLEQLARLHVLICAFGKLDQLESATRDDVLATLGVSQDQADVLRNRPVADRWQVIAQEVEQEDKLRAQRSWLFGQSTGRAAMILNFAHGNAALDASLVPGFWFEGELCFYSGRDVRAIVRARNDLKRIESLTGVDTLDDACSAYSDLAALQPWLTEVVLPLRDVVPVRTGESWVLLDSQRRAMTARLSDERGWRVLALSGGHPIDIVASFDGEEMRPLSILASGEFVTLQGAVDA